MKTKLSFLAVGLFMAALGTALSQPIITQQPRSSTNAVGSTVTLSVVATGTEPLAYQWQKQAGSWSNLAGAASFHLVLTNVQTSQAGNYRVVVTNAGGTTTSDVARLTVLVPPRIVPTTNFQHQAVHIGTSASFVVTASGSSPLSYQWRLDDSDLPSQTNKTLIIPATQPIDEGDYTVVVKNSVGSIASEAARLWIVPPASQLLQTNFFSQGQRLPYFYYVPTNYTANRSYALVCLFHGAGADENTFTQPIPGVGAGYANWPAFKVFASYRQQEADPAILIYPTLRWNGNGDWSDKDIELTATLLTWLITQYNIDANRVYVEGLSQGVHAAWDLLGLRPSFFAGAMVQSGRAGSKAAIAIKDVPMWCACAQDDYGQLYNMQEAVRALRIAGGNPIYTEYQAGAHIEAIALSMCMPVTVKWLLAQRRAIAPVNEPLLSITNPALQTVLRTGMTNMGLAGSAQALERDVTRVNWINFANNSKGLAEGTNFWSVANIPLVANKTNVISVVATTTSWAPAFGGNTTFSDTLIVVHSPLEATLKFEGAEAILNWTGGGPPYHVQRTTDLAGDDWTDYLTDATPPVSLPLTGQAGFYRILGQ